MPRQSDLTAESKRILAALASDDGPWKGYLDVMSQHTGRARRRAADGSFLSVDNLSTLNCAQVAISGYEDTREVMTAREWSKLFPGCAPRDGEPGIPVMKASSTRKTFWEDVAYPASAMDGLPEKRFHNFTSRVDLRDDVDAECWNSALASELHVQRPDAEGEDAERVVVSLDDVDPAVRYVVLTHFGVDAAEPPAAPAIEDVDDVKAYCDQIKSDSAALMSQIERSLRKTKDEIMGIVREPSKEAELEAPGRNESPARDDLAADLAAPSRKGNAFEAADPPAPTVPRETFFASGRDPNAVAEAAKRSVSRPQDHAGPTDLLGIAH